MQRAHAAALLAAGVYDGVEHEAVCGALDRLEAAAVALERPPTVGTCSDSEDLHTWIEGMLTELAGDAGRKIHTARSRNDQVATLQKLYVIDCGTRLSAELRGLSVIACERAKKWAGLAFPLQTHQQFAAPGSVGFWLLRYATAFERVRRHLEACMEEWRRYCPLGAGAVAGSSIPLDRMIQARELGFAAPAPNALDATSTRDECLELLAVGTQLALHLQSLATDIIVFSQTSLGWTKYPRAFGTGSSMMPNKLNPDAMELLRGECNTVSAAHAEIVLLGKGLPSGYNRDWQCIKPIVNRAAEKLVSLVQMTAAFVEQLDFDTDRLAASLREGHVGATLRMEEIVQTGVPLRAAHHAVAAEVAQAEDGAVPDISDPLKRYQTAGSTNPTEVCRVADAILAGLRTA